MQWYNFYKDRINSTYQLYFEKRYSVFLEMILNTQKPINELGCGIGSVSKFLIKHEISCVGFDNCNEMVELANQNVGMEIFRPGDMLTEKHRGHLNVSHGVLEHFQDEDIQMICKKFGGIHYVPLDTYKTPSFGDERLLPASYWLDLVQPKKFSIFNNGHDLAFII